MTDRKLGEDVMGVFDDIELGLGLIDKSVFIVY